MQDEQKRRCYEKGQCPFHPLLQEQVSKSLPRWVFVSAFGTLVTLALIFAGWHVNSIASLDAKYEKQITSFNSLAQQNKELLIEVHTNQKELIKKFDKLDSELHKR